ncbi:hypothetical protein KF707C_p10 (plasmid) [Metapseudomonas furukawaii]|uniref:Uncharacterized protein n=2 Tax=Metapseudomonas furukawaii TaxID=1149133 RepID=A0AAD1C5S0_METFU|nr:hypothetical protein KF707C_p10 [Pseudomonas furukawaii]
MLELDEGLIVLASLAAERMGIPLPLFVNQALQEKLLRLMDLEQQRGAGVRKPEGDSEG